MAWIESHQTLREHPKLYSLMAAGNMSRHAAIGHLHLLWWWAIDYAPDGVLHVDDNAIARAAEWGGDANEFVKMLVQSGFIDSTENGKSLHDWLDYCGQLVEKRLKRRAAKRRKVAAVRRKVAAVRTPTQPNRTQPNPTVPNPTRREEPSVSPKRRTNGQLSDTEFLQALKSNPAYTGIDIDIELGKMDAWFMTPKARGRKKTHRFIVAWLNRCERPISAEPDSMQDRVRRIMARREKEGLPPI